MLAQFTETITHGPRALHCRMPSRRTATVVVAASGGAVVAAAVGASLVSERLAPNRHKAVLLIKNADKLWLFFLARGVKADALAYEQARYGTRESHNGEADAARHAYATALFVLRLQRDHGLSRADAEQLVREAGIAQERDGVDNSATAHRMDEHNNDVGIALAGEGKGPGGGWLSEKALQQRVEKARLSGRLQRLSDDGRRLQPTG